MNITSEILIDIMAESSYRLHKEIRKAYKDDDLENYLSSIGMKDIYPIQEEKLLYDTDPEGKILIVGQSMIKENQVYGCMKNLGIEKDRVEMYLDYNEAKTISFENTLYNPNYRLILFGPMPHSGKSKKDKSSIITQIESGDGYPKVIRLTDSHGLKITKTSLKEAVEEQIDSGYLAI